MTSARDWEVNVGDYLISKKDFSLLAGSFRFSVGERLKVHNYDGLVGRDKRYTLMNAEGKVYPNWNIDKEWFDLAPSFTPDEMAKAQSLPSHDELKDFFGV